MPGRMSLVRRSVQNATGGCLDVRREMLMLLNLFGKEVESVFALNGDGEDSITYALGWSLSQSPALLATLGKDLFGQPIEFDDARIDLQQSGQDRGFTDIEIFSPSGPHIIIEAKRNWDLPGTAQLKKYASRIGKETGRGGLIVSLSAASREYAADKLPNKLGGIRVEHRSWSDLSKIVNDSYGCTTKFGEKLWLDHLQKHLRGYISMRNVKDNTVFVVSLSSEAIKKDDDSYTWVDVIEKDSKYFHPVGNRWPVIPPNYIGFRLNGRLRSVHHIESYKVVTDLSQKNRRWPQTDSDHFVYKLGPSMQPAKEIKNGKIWPSGRYWCAIDTLLSGHFKTISDARDETKKRVIASD